MICCWAQHLAEAVILHRLGPHDGSRQEADGAITHRPSLPPLRLTPVPSLRGTWRPGCPAHWEMLGPGRLRGGGSPSAPHLPLQGRSFKFGFVISFSPDLSRLIASTFECTSCSPQLIRVYCIVLYFKMYFIQV